MMQPSRRERFYFYNTLVGVVKGLEGQYTTIDLQNEACLTGKIKNVDGYMNIDMEDVVFYDSRGSEHAFETFFVRGRLVRYVHIPKNQPAIEIMNNLLQKVLTARPSRKIDNFKTRRAKRYQKEIIESLYTRETSKGGENVPT